MSEEERERRRDLTQQWIRGNTDPRTGLGRHVFRRGCHQQCLTQILGGDSENPWPVLSKTPPVINGAPNPFVKNGEFFIAGNVAWNSFGPRFPGDIGLANIQAFTDHHGVIMDQKEFHLFVQCSDNITRRHWHGPDAKGGRMYVGVYRRVPVNPDDEVTEDYRVVPYSALGEELRHNLAAFIYRRTTQFSKYALEDRHFHTAQEVHGDDVTWKALTDHQRGVPAMVMCLKEREFVQRAVPVEFVRYDEDLYQALVDSGATMANKQQTGIVSVDPNVLGLLRYPGDD